jgi:hypothetical protein
MPGPVDILLRLEPDEPPLPDERPYRVEVHDPMWFLARQWQLGEHQGEDAASPVRVSFQVHATPLGAPPGMAVAPADLALDPIIESEPDSWWTIGRRVRLGSAYVAAGGTPRPGHYQFHDLPPPYERMNGRAWDGLALFRADPNHAVFASVPRASVDFWDPEQLAYRTLLSAASNDLVVERHDGGELDWYSVDAVTASAAPGTVAAPPTVAGVRLPNRLRYPGSPPDRWWQIENRQDDVGGFAPDRSHFTTLLLIDAISGHSNDWYTFPIDARAGTIASIDQIHVFDSFDRTWTIAVSPAGAIYTVRGLASGARLVWPRVQSPLAGPPIEEVDVVTDAAARLLWAIERRVGGRQCATGDAVDPPAAGGSGSTAERTRYTYRATAGVGAGWHPYVFQEVAGRMRFVQARLADLDATPPVLAPEPRAELLHDRAHLAANPAQQTGPVHQIDPAALPAEGVHLERRFMLCRRTDGSPCLWLQRRRRPARPAPATALRFDAMDSTKR